MCPPLETTLMVQPQADSAKGQAHSGVPECESREAVQTQTGNSEWSLLQGGVQPLVYKVAHSSSESTRFNHKLPKFVYPVPNHKVWKLDVLYCIVYLYSAQYLHILQDSKRYLTNRLHKYSPNSQVSDIPLNVYTELYSDQGGNKN